MYLVEIHHLGAAPTERLAALSCGPGGGGRNDARLGALTLCLGVLFLSPFCHTGWLSHRCFLVKLTSTRYPLGPKVEETSLHSLITSLCAANANQIVML